MKLVRKCQKAKYPNAFDLWLNVETLSDVASK
jgi:hypothetical protein